MTKKIQLITLIDRSGSMGGKVQHTVDAYNELVSSLRHQGVQAKSLVASFDNEFTVVQDFTKLKKVVPLTANNPDIQPRGLTALYDAICKVCALGNPQKPCVVQIISDGGENMSREATLQIAQKCVKEYEGFGWEFQFVGMDINLDTALSGMTFAAGTRSAMGSTVSLNASGLRGASGPRGDIGMKVSSYYNAIQEEAEDVTDNKDTEAVSSVPTSSVD